VERALDSAQKKTWSTVTALARSEPTSQPASLMHSALNAAFDMRVKYRLVNNNQVPPVILWLLSISTILTLGDIGYNGGLNGKRNGFVTGLLAVLVIGIIYVIVDLDRPRHGMIKIEPTAFIELRDVPGL